MDNRTVLTGEVTKPPETRCSPAGIPITRFFLRHHSQQTEAGLPREVQCSIGVVAAGEELQEQARQLISGRQVRVSGFLSRANYRQGEYRLILHAQTLELL